MEGNQTLDDIDEALTNALDQVNDDGTAMAKNYDPINRPLRQDWNGELIENGAFYFTRKETFLKVTSFSFQHVS